MSEPHCCINCFWWDSKWDDVMSGTRTCHSPDTPPNYLSDTLTGCTFHDLKTDHSPAPWHERKPKKDPAAVKRGRSVKKQGKRGEDELAKERTKQTGEVWERRGGDNDVQPRDTNSPFRSVHTENKHHHRVGAMRFCEQAMRDAATHGKSEWVVSFREIAKPGQKRPMRIAMIPDEDYVRMKMAEFELWRLLGGPLTMQELHERREKDEDV